MKRKIALMLVVAVLMAASVAFGESSASDGAEQTETAGNAFDEYDKKGYTHGSVSVSEDETGNVLSVYFNSADRSDCLRVDAALTEEDRTALDALDFFDEHYYENQWKIITGLPADRIIVASLNDQIPSAEEMSLYVGKTIADLMNDGYEWFTDAEDEDGRTIMIFHSYDTHVNYAVDIDRENLDVSELSDEKIGIQTIRGLRFWGFDD